MAKIRCGNCRALRILLSQETGISRHRGDTLSKMIKCFALSVGIGALLLILEPETAHAEQVAYKQYNNCRVITDRDEFTDKETTYSL